MNTIGRTESSIIADIVAAAHLVTDPKEILRKTVGDNTEYVVVNGPSFNLLVKLLDELKENQRGSVLVEPFPEGTEPIVVTAELEVPESVAVFLKQLRGWGVHVYDFEEAIKQAKEYNETEILQYLYKYRAFYKIVLQKVFI